MKKLVLAAALVSSVLAVAQNANAEGESTSYDGRVTFNGKIVDSTCTVATGSQDLTVTLPTIAKQSFKAAGDVRGKTPFDIELTNCPNSVTGGSGEALTHVRVYFHSDPANVNPQGRIKNTLTTKAATNVDIQLRDASDTALNIDTDIAHQGTANVALSQNVKIRYYAEYYATSADVGAGDVQGHVTYTVAYQ